MLKKLLKSFSKISILFIFLFFSCAVPLVDVFNYGNSASGANGSRSSSIIHENRLYNFETNQVGNWNVVQESDMRAMRSRAWDTSFGGINGSSGSMRVSCNFIGPLYQTIYAKGGVAHICYDNPKNLTGRTIFFSLYVPQDLIDLNESSPYGVEIYIKSTNDWIWANSDRTEILSSGWHTYSWNLENNPPSSGNVAHVVEIGAQILMGSDSLDWSGDIYFDDIDWIPSPVDITFSGPSSVEIGSDLTINATTDPSSIDSYQWYLDGIELTGETNSSITIGSGLDIGNYVLTLGVSLNGYQTYEDFHFLVTNPAEEWIIYDAGSYLPGSENLTYPWTIHGSTDSYTYIVNDSNCENGKGLYVSVPEGMGKSLSFSQSNSYANSSPWTTSVENAKGWEMECRLKIVESGTRIVASDGTYYFEFWIRDNSIYIPSWIIEGDTQSIPIDMTDGYHTVKIKVKGESFKVYVDGSETAGIDAQLINERPGSRFIIWGGCPHGNVRVYWDYFKYNIYGFGERLIEIFFTLPSTEIDYGEDMTINTETYPAAVDNLQWYLDDVELTGETSHSITIGSMIPVGDHTLKLTASTGANIRTKERDFRVIGLGGEWVAYEAENDYLPDDVDQEYKWTNTYFGFNTAVVENDTDCVNGKRLRISTSETIFSGGRWFYEHDSGGQYWYDNVRSSDGYSIEARFKVISTGPEGGQAIWVTDNLYRFGILITESQIEVPSNFGYIEPPTRTYDVDLTDAYHTITVDVINTDLSIKLDGVEIITAVLSWGPYPPGTYPPEICFGYILSNVPESGGTVYWDYFKYKCE